MRDNTNNNYNTEFININNKDDMDYLVNRIQNGPIFAEPFKFKTKKLRNNLLSALNLSVNEFDQKYFYYDHEKKIHISESEKGYIWISTMGLIAQKGSINNINNQFVKACCSQYIVLCLLVDKAISLCEDEKTYDVDGYNYGYLNELTPQLFHSTLFYFEIFGKAYLSLNNVEFKKHHKLSEILQKVKETMFTLGHNDTSFHAYVISAFEYIVKYISTIPGNFKEQYVKYEDNSGDSTVIRFDQNELLNMKNTINLSHDFISNFYYNKGSGDILHLKQGLYNRLLEMSKNDEEKKRIINTYSYLINKA